MCTCYTRQLQFYSIFSISGPGENYETREKLQDLVLKLVDREPDLLFDLLKCVEDSNDDIPKPGPSRSRHTPT